MRIVIVAAALTLVACGQKGPLQAPPPPTDKNSTVSHDV
ncbi:LPS translocon maturation chaperone LptM [Pseudidiomarina mangrovi]